jgi:signal transduction histidine kinase
MVFIIAIVLSGGILTYFSINNISNLKELTEKRILEEQQLVSTSFSLALQTQLERVTADFNKEMDDEFIIQPFILDNKGKFIFPQFVGIPESEEEPFLSESFKAAYTKGEGAEFAEKDPAEASKYYKSCLQYATGEIDSVIALNALGRISVKSDQIAEATAYYSLILLEYYMLADRNGFPYAYYAFYHLINNSTSDNIEQHAPLIEFFFEKMSEGNIPFNFQSEELLNLASAWLEEHPLDSPERSAYLTQLILGLNQQVHFVNENGTGLSALARDRRNEAQYSDSSGFQIADPPSGSNKELLLLHVSSDSTRGILIDRDLLFDTITNSGIQDGLEFEYSISFPTGYTSQSPESNLSYTSQLTPYFPEQYLQIKILNENLISDLIKRRSWIYGIASVLLLLAMLLGVVLILRDIAREKKLATLRSGFISNVTHELKTPLTSIRMYAESVMMKRMKSESDQKRYLSNIVNESERLKRMINNILGFSRMEKAKQDYNLIEANLSEILHSAIQDMKFWLDKQDFKLSTKINPELSAFVDPEKLHQVYTNLLSNAIKYSGDSRNIYIRLYQESKNIVTEFEDEGIGISTKDQTRVFEEFYRVNDRELGNITGTGLGLTVVKEIVEAHHGKIIVESEPGKGSKFSVILSQI